MHFTRNPWSSKLKDSLQNPSEKRASLTNRLKETNRSTNLHSISGRISQNNNRRAERCRIGGSGRVRRVRRGCTQQLWFSILHVIDHRRNCLQLQHVHASIKGGGHLPSSMVTVSNQKGETPSNLLIPSTGQVKRWWRRATLLRSTRFISLTITSNHS